MIEGLVYLKHKNSIFIKTLVSYIIIFAIPFLIFGIAIYYWMVNVVNEQTESTYVGALQDVKRELDGDFDSLNVFAVRLSYIPWIKKYMTMQGNNLNYDRVDIIEMINGMQELGIYNATYDLVDNIAIYFNDKDTILSTICKDNLERFFKDTIRYKNISTSQWKQLLSGYNNRFTLLPDDAWVSNQTCRLMAYIQSLPPGDKSFRATLILFTDENTLKNILKKSSILNNGSLYILDSNSNFITGININDGIKDYVKKQKFENTTGNIIRNIKFSDKESYKVFYTNSEKNGWRYIAVVPMGAILSKISYIKIFTMLISFFYLSIGLLLSYKLTMNNYKPLANIIDIIRAKIFPEEKAENEFKLLENAIYSMLTNANRSESEILLYKPLAKNTFLIKFLKNEAGINEELDKAMNILGITFPFKNFICIYVLLSEDNTFSEVFQDAVNQSVAGFNATACFAEFDSRNKVVILNTDMSDINREIADILILCFENVKISYRTIGISKVCNSIAGIRQAYEEAAMSVEYRFIKEEGSVIYWEEIDDSNDWIGCIIEEEQIINSIKSCDAENAISLSKEALKRNIEGRHLSSGMIKYLCYSIATIALKAMEDMNIVLPPSVNLKEILQTDSISGMIKNIEKIYLEACTLLSKEKESHNVQLIQDIIKFINKNYNNHSLSLTAIAETFDISPSYLSRFFKNQTGNNFVDYLNKLRIEASQPLLISDMTVMQVADLVGFDNDITFRRLFKKYTGKTPGNFKNI